MNEITVFQNNDFGQVRSIEVDGTPYFVGKDVAEILGYSDPQKAIKMHIDDEDKLTRQIVVSGQNRNVTIINESGLYSLILSSKLPKAKEFKHWVTAEILPTIRKHGSYTVHDTGDKHIKTAAEKQQELEIRLMNARVRMSNQLLKLTKVETLSEQYKNVLVAKSAEVLTGEKLLPLPKSEKTYSASDIAEILGVSSQKIGRIAKEHNLKIKEYGEWYRDKSPYSNKEVDTFRYNDKAVEKFKEFLS